MAAGESADQCWRFRCSQRCSVVGFSLSLISARIKHISFAYLAGYIFAHSGFFGVAGVPFWSGLVGVSVSSTPAGLLSLQKSWDAPVVAVAHDALLGWAQDSYTEARLAAVAAPHAGDWLKAIPSSSLGLRLEDEAMRVSVGLRIGTNLCTLHTCVCGNPVDARGAHGLSCIKALSSDETFSHQQ